MMRLTVAVNFGEPAPVFGNKARHDATFFKMFVLTPSKSLVGMIYRGSDFEGVYGDSTAS